MLGDDAASWGKQLGCVQEFQNIFVLLRELVGRVEVCLLYTSCV